MSKHRFSGIIREWTELIRRQKTKKKRPLISHQKDIALIRKVRGNTMPNHIQLRHIFRILSGREKFMLRAAMILFSISGLWIIGSSINSKREQVPAIGGRYTEAVVGSPQLINPLFASTNDVDLDITRLVYNGLMRVDEQQQLTTDLAKEYTISEDKKVYTFVLKDGITWHDGEPFTAKDVFYTFESIQDELVGSPLRVSFLGVKVEIVEDNTIQFTLSEPFAPFLSSLTVGIIPEHIWANISPERIKLAKENLQPIGTGPFQFKKLSKDSTGYIFQYELERNPNYYDKPPYLKEFMFKFFAEYDHEGGAIDALRSQQVDGISFVPSDLKSRVERKNIVLLTLQLPQYTALFFNQNKEPVLKDKDVRTALSYTIDKDRILREALKDEGQVIYSPVLPGFPGYNPEIEKTPYDVDKANELLEKNWKKISASDYREERLKTLLKEAGIQENAEDTASSTPEETGNNEAKKQEITNALDQELSSAQTFYRENKDGEILTLSLVTVNTSEYRQTANVIAGYWQDVGVKVNVTFIEPRDISRQVLKARDYDVLLYGVIIGSDPDQYPFWHSSQVTFPGLNLSGYVNRTVDELLKSARESDDQNEVAELYGKFQDLVLDEVPAIFLHTPTYTYATTDKIKGINLSRIFSPSDRFNGITNWYIKTKGQWKQK
ncbi:MAG: peptide ABC transporter substrate-binding protein [Candidatus Magasanikbacteria bacterium]|uniref:Solute-binding protein family 5 domain-containing protein n=1 Tax=Candidatus Magasanikbacteria bacterium CG10_big_fil_rev_8_21_14_0_10_38_6 TaxID=1974647 RepID=A0A2M6P211_9BACT|nr:peptide ABC transporter substrate-binding protein [Candidatus Magasanikbacteria bacterium]PIR77773.1 MAG: hypothetical protein COU30_00650 [Candidatus Magasanikbacteria bacterium CG10_big_fil_rev_8_21_14_0_10_38_6]